MSKLTLIDLWLVIDNIIRVRLSFLLLLDSGAFYERQMRSMLARTGTIPEIADSKRAFSDELAAEDLEHDTFGQAIDLLLQFYEKLGNRVPAETRESVARIRAQIIPDTSALRDGYIDESIATKRRRLKLEALEPDLAALPVAGLGSAVELAEQFTIHGENIDTLLSKRGDAEQTPQGRELRSQMLSMLNDLSHDIQRQHRGERRIREQILPANVETKIFGYANALLQLRNDGNNTETPEDDIDLIDDETEQPPSPTPSDT